MIIEIQKANGGLSQSIDYNYRKVVVDYNYDKVEADKGRVIFSNNITSEGDTYITKEMYKAALEPYLKANIRTENTVFHASINPVPGTQFSDELIAKVAAEYMEKMGYGRQPYVVFRHNDIDRVHYHIISIRVGRNGKKINDSYERLHSTSLSRELEKKYHLATHLSGDYSQRESATQDIRTVLSMATEYNLENVSQLRCLLEAYGITLDHYQTHRGSNMGYVSLYGSKPIELSEIGVDIDKMVDGCRRNASLNKGQKARLRGYISSAMRYARDEKQLLSMLEKNGISLHLIRNADERVTGVIVIDHQNRAVVKGSSLGKEFSANIVNQWCQDHSSDFDDILAVATYATTPSTIDDRPINIDEWIHPGHISTVEDEYLQELAERKRNKRKKKKKTPKQKI